MTTQVTRDVELASWSKQQLIDFMDEHSVPAGGLSPSKVRKAPKDELVQFILEWEQACRMAAQSTQKNVQNTPAPKVDGKVPAVLGKQAKNYDPSKPGPDAFRLKKIPSNRNRENILQWSEMYGFGTPTSPVEFMIEDDGLVILSFGKVYEFWSNGSSYWAVAK